MLSDVIRTHGLHPDIFLSLASIRSFPEIKRSVASRRHTFSDVCLALTRKASEIRHDVFSRIVLKDRVSVWIKPAGAAFHPVWTRASLFYLRPFLGSNRRFTKAHHGLISNYNHTRTQLLTCTVHAFQSSTFEDVFVAIFKGEREIFTDAKQHLFLSVESASRFLRLCTFVSD